MLQLLSFCLHEILSVCPCLSVHSAFLPLCHSVFLSFCLSAFLLFCLSVCLSACLTLIFQFWVLIVKKCKVIKLTDSLFLKLLFNFSHPRSVALPTFCTYAFLEYAHLPSLFSFFYLSFSPLKADPDIEKSELNKGNFKVINFLKKRKYPDTVNWYW